MATMPAKRLLFATFLMLVAGLYVSVPVPAKDTRMLIDQVPVFVGFRPATPLREDQYPEAKAALVKALNEQWKGRYRIVAQRFYIYLFAPNDRRTFPLWIAFEKYIDNYFRDDVKGEKEYDEVTSNSEPLATVWKLGDQRFAVAQAMTPLPHGGALCGYFQLEKEQ